VAVVVASLIAKKVGSIHNGRKSQWQDCITICHNIAICAGFYIYLLVQTYYIIYEGQSNFTKQSKIMVK
jgi:hypothetical protein